MDLRPSIHGATQIVAPRLSYVVATPDVSAMAMAWVGWSDATLERLAEIGYQGVEIQTRDPRSLDWESIARSLARAGLVATGISTGPVSTEDGLYLTSPDEHRRRGAIERLVAATEFAAHLGTHVAIGGIRGFRKWAVDDATADSWFAASLDIVLAHAEPLGAKVILEPQNRFASDFLNQVGETVAFIEAQGSPALGIEVDLYHMALEEESIPAALVTAHASGRLIHVQVSDSNRLAPGWGHLNWQDIGATLRALGYDRWISVEASQIPDSESVARQGFRFLNAMQPRVDTRVD